MSARNAIPWALVILLAGWIALRPDDGGEPAARARPSAATTSTDAVNSPPVAAPSSDPEDLLPQTSSEPTPAVDEFGVVVLLTATLSDGAPASQVLLELRQEGDEPWTMGTDEEGRITIAGIRPGPLFVKPRMGGIRSTELELAIAPQPTTQNHAITLPLSTWIPIELAGSGGRPIEETEWYAGLSGRLGSLKVVGTSGPDPSSLRELRDGGPTVRIVGAHWDAPIFQPYLALRRSIGRLGAYSADIDPPFRVHLTRGDSILASASVEAGTEEVTFVIDDAQVAMRTAELRLRVIDHAGEPVSGLRVSVGNLWAQGGSGTTGDDGRVAIGGLSLASFGVFLRRDDEELWCRSIEIDAPEVIDLGSIVVEEPVTVRGVVRGETGGVPFGSLRLYVLDGLPPDATLSTFTRYLQRHTERDGSFSFTLPRGRFALHLVGDERIIPQLLDTRHGPILDLDLTAAPRVDVEVTSASSLGRPVHLEIWHDGVQPVLRRSGPEGEFPALPLAPGRYTLRYGSTFPLPCSQPLIVGTEPLEVFLDAETASVSVPEEE